jgi:hypothetical protein
MNVGVYILHQLLVLEEGRQRAERRQVLPCIRAMDGCAESTKNNPTTFFPD